MINRKEVIVSNSFKIIYLTILILISVYAPVTAEKILIYEEENKMSYYLLMDNYKKINNDNYEFFLLTSNKERNLKYRFKVRTKIENNLCFVVEVNEKLKEKKDKDYLILTLNKNSVIYKSYDILKSKNKGELDDET